MGCRVPGAMAVPRGTAAMLGGQGAPAPTARLGPPRLPDERGARLQAEERAHSIRNGCDQAAIASSAGVGRLSNTSSIRPNAFASSASRNLSRSIAVSIASIGCLVYFA